MIRRYYRCVLVPRRAKIQCASRARLVLCQKNKTVSVEKTPEAHNHHTLGVIKRGIPSATKAIFTELLDMRMSTAQIKLRLFDLKIECPGKRQLQNFIQARRKAETPAMNMLKDFDEWCKTHSAVPADINEAFVAKSQLDYPTNDSPGNQMRAFLTTKNLLQNSANAKRLHADATYKLVTNGFPGLVLGVTDANAKFNLVGIAVCPTQNGPRLRISRIIQGGVRGAQV